MERTTRQVSLGARCGVALALALGGCAGDVPGGAAGEALPWTDLEPRTSGPPGWIRAGSATAGTLTVDVYSDRTLGTGLTPLAIRISGEGGAPVDDAAVTFAASRLAPGGAARAAPVLGAPALAPDGTYRVEAVFTDPSGAAGGWTATVGIARPGAPAVAAELAGLAVADRGLAVPFGAAAAFVLGVRFEGALGVGRNPVAVAVHETGDGGASWTPVADATFAVEPFMPSMGHGSTGSVAPTPSGPPGRYAGEVSLSMPGDWEIAFTVSRQGAELGRPVVAVYF